MEGEVPAVDVEDLGYWLEGEDAGRGVLRLHVKREEAYVSSCVNDDYTNSMSAVTRLDLIYTMYDTGANRFPIKRNI